MWILNFLPEWSLHALLIVAVLTTIAGFVLTMIPVIKTYAIPIKIIGIILLSTALYLEGGLSEKKDWELKAKELEVKIAEAEAKSQKENVKIVEKVVKKTEYYRLRGNDVIQYVDREVTKYDNQCVIPKEFVKAHNDAAEKQK
jgi:hypothetical protein